jgi:SAM-dependent methyltransferase
LIPSTTLDAQEIKAQEVFQRPWYYSIELAPGVYTEGAGHKNVAITRKLLKNVDIEGGGTDRSGAKCLDLGTQEALVTLLFERRAASTVVGYDRVSREDRIELIRRALNARFQFIGGMPLAALPRTVRAYGHRFFDVIVFSGVLYHLLDPVAGLATARGLVRNGGILIVESRLAFDDEFALYLNTNRRFGKFAIWLMSVPCLDYLLRFLRLEVLDVAYIGPMDRRGSVPATGRVAAACRAVSEPTAEPGDEWMSWPGFKRDLIEFLDWQELHEPKPVVEYRSPGGSLVRRPAGSIDLAATLESTDPHMPNPDEIRLAMDAKY